MKHFDSIFKKLKITSILIIISALTSAAYTMEQKEIVRAVLKGDSPDFEEAIDFIKTNHPPSLPRELKDEYLDDDDEETRERILAALKLYNPGQYAPLWIEILKESSNTQNEIEIIEFLGKYKIFTLLIAERLIAPRSEIREKAALTLKDTGDDRILPVILKLSKSSNPVDRIYLLEALNHLYDIRFQRLVISFLGDENKSVRIYALQCVMDNDIRDSIHTIKRLVSSDDNDEVRIKAIQALVHFRDSGSGYTIASVLKERKKNLSLEAIKALGQLGYNSAAGPVSELLLKETDRELKEAAIVALAGFGRAGNINGLRHIVTEEKDPILRIKAVYTLGDVHEERATMDILKLSLTDRDYRVRGEACNALGKLRRNRPSSILLDKIKTESSRYVRSAALYSLQRIKHEKDLVPLFDIYSTEQDPVFRDMLKKYLRANLVKLVR